MKVRKVRETGFCFGVKRAIEILKETAQKQGSVETLGALVHNEQVMESLSSQGIKVVHNIDEIKGRVVAISAHGVSPSVENELRRKPIEVIDTTCPSVRRAQKAAQKLAKEGFFVVVYGEAQHPEVKGILGWAQEKGLATLDEMSITRMDKLPRRIGLLSQTTQIPENFMQFAKKTIDLALNHGSEIYIIDTICQGVRKRQSDSLDLAGRVDLMLVIGGRTSANSRRLMELCSTVTETYLIGSAGEIDKDWLKGKKNIGVTSGTSTSEPTIEEVIRILEETD